MGRLDQEKKEPISILAGHIAEKLLALRRGRHVSMATINEETGVGVATISGIEGGQSVPRADTLWLLAEYFHVTPDHFFEGYKGEE